MDQEDVTAMDGPGTHRVAAGGWRRVLLGFLVGAAVGAAIGLIMPRDDGPIRASSQG